MTNTEKSLIALAVAVVGVLIFGAYQFPQVSTLVSSPAGTTFNTAKYAGVRADLGLPGSTGTSTSVQNTDASDRIITGLRHGCQAVGTSRTAYSGAGLASLLVTAATSSTASPSTNSNTNSVGGGAITIATSTPNFAVSTSSATGAGSSAIFNIWPAGSYLTFTTNATNTATCTFGADYIGT